jgi:hypothetical protein
MSDPSWGALSTNIGSLSVGRRTVSEYLMIRRTPQVNFPQPDFLGVCPKTTAFGENDVMSRR